MTEEKEKSGITLTSILIGIGIGAIAVYLFLKNRNPTMTLQNQQLSPDANSNLGLGLNALQQRIDSIEIKLDRLQTQQLTSVQMPLSINQQPQISPEMTYKNKMKIVRDQNGDIVSIERDAKIK